MADLLDISFQFPGWLEKIRQSEQSLNLFCAAQIQANRGMLFDAEGARNGHKKWAPLQFRAGQIMSNRGALRQSIGPQNPRGTPGADGIVRFTGETIVVGTTLLYARLMNDGTTKMPGGVLRPKNAKALKIPVPNGKNAGPAAQSIQIQSLAPCVAAAHHKAMVAKPGSKSAERAYQTWTRLTEKATQGKGDVKFIFRKSVKIPARNFTDWNDQDQDEVDGAFMARLTEIMNG